MVGTVPAIKAWFAAPLAYDIAIVGSPAQTHRTECQSRFYLFLVCDSVGWGKRTYLRREVWT